MSPLAIAASLRGPVCFQTIAPAGETRNVSGTP